MLHLSSSSAGQLICKHTALNPGDKKEGAVGIMEERGFHSNSPSVIDV